MNILSFILILDERTYHTVTLIHPIPVDFLTTTKQLSIQRAIFRMALAEAHHLDNVCENCMMKKHVDKHVSEKNTLLIKGNLHKLVFKPKATHTNHIHFFISYPLPPSAFHIPSLCLSQCLPAPVLKSRTASNDSNALKNFIA